jgi:hypothetical protein
LKIRIEFKEYKEGIICLKPAANSPKPKNQVVSEEELA